MHSQNATGTCLTAKEYIRSRLNMFENLYDLYTKKYGIDEDIKRWKDVILLRDIYHLTHMLLLNNESEYKVFVKHVKLTYPPYYKKLLKNKRYFVSRYFLLPVIKNKFLRKIAAFIFPGKPYFKKDYTYAYSS